MVYLKPVLPAMAARAERFLGGAPLTWTAAATPLLGHTISTYEPLITRVDPAAVTRMVQASKPATETEMRDASGESGKTTESAIDLETFLRSDLRVATVLNAEIVEGAEKLLRVTVDLGGGEERTVLAGIRGSYEPAALVGRQVVVVANLKARKMRFGVSEGMLLAASDETGGGIYLIGPDSGAKAGMRVR
jgi:methionyl-tRNA synthetase